MIEVPSNGGSDRPTHAPGDPLYAQYNAPYHSNLQKDLYYWRKQYMFHNPFDAMARVRPIYFKLFDPIAKKEFTSREWGVQASTRDPDDNLFRLGLRVAAFSVFGAILGGSLASMNMLPGRFAPFLPLRKYGFVQSAKRLRAALLVSLVGNTWIVSEYAARKYTGKVNKFDQFNPYPKLFASLSVTGLYWALRGGSKIPMGLLLPTALFGLMIDYDVAANGLDPEQYANASNPSRKWLAMLRHMPTEAYRQEHSVNLVVPDPVVIPLGSNFGFQFKPDQQVTYLNPVHYFQTRKHAADSTVPAHPTGPVVLNQPLDKTFVHSGGLDVTLLTPPGKTYSDMSIMGEMSK